MIENTALREPVPAVAGGVTAERQSYIDWPSIAAGGVVASAVSIIMLTFGGALGLSLVSAEPREGVSAQWFLIAAGIWFLWVAISSFGAGGYIAGRMRRRTGDATASESDVRDGVNGLVVWGLGVLLAVVLSLSGALGVMGAAGTAIGTTVEAGATAVDDVDLGYRSSVLLRPEGTDGMAPQVDERAAAETSMVLSQVLTTGEIDAADRAYLVERVAVWTGVDEATAEARVNEAVTQVQQAREAAIEAVERARVMGIVLAFVAAAALVVSAATAYFAAVAGGSHRDQGIFIGE